MKKEEVHGVKEAYIRFMAGVTPQTTDQLIRLLDDKINKGYDKVHLLLSSPGGSVFHGLSLHNFIKGSPVEIDTYNFGSVDSIGVILFCAGSKRYCVPHARFLLHGVSFNINGQHHFDEKQLEEHLKGLQIDQNNIAKVIAATTKQKTDKVESDMHNRTTLNPEEAREYGLVHEIRSQLFPANAEFYSIGEFAAAPPQVMMPNFLPVQNPMIPQQKMSIDPQMNNYTSWFDNGFTYTNSCRY